MNKKRLITAGGTLLCALGIGYFMQIGSNAPVRAPVQNSAGMVNTTPATPDAEQMVQLDEVKTVSVPRMQELPQAPEATEIAVLPEEQVTKAAIDDQPLAQMPKDEVVPNFSCEHTLSAKVEAAAIVRLTLEAPCMVNERFTMHHNGMMFTSATNTAGKSELLVPALSEAAVFIVAFGNGEGAVANATVSSLEYYDRAVLQWKGNSGMQVHALEYGSDYGSSGHVWGEAARDAEIAAVGEGGFLMRLGDPDMSEALLAEVYSFPTGVAKRGGEVALNVEAEITTLNCGRDIEAQSIQTSPGGELKTQDLVLSMPDCDSVGDFLVLKNLLNDLKIAGS